MILDLATSTAYILIATALAVAPGPDVFFVVANGMRHKVKGAIASALGIGGASVLHALASALGISAIVVASPGALETLRYVGAAYLTYLGVQALKSWWNYSHNYGPDQTVLGISVWSIFRRGLATNALNPKILLFYLALLPQFVNVEIGNVGLQIFFLDVSIISSVSLSSLASALWLEKLLFG